MPRDTGCSARRSFRAAALGEGGVVDLVIWRGCRGQGGGGRGAALLPDGGRQLPACLLASSSYRRAKSAAGRAAGASAKGGAAEMRGGLARAAAAAAVLAAAGPAASEGVTAGCINSCNAQCSVEDTCTEGCYAWKPSSTKCRYLCLNGMGLTACAKNKGQGLGLVWNPVAGDCATGCTWPMLYNGKCDQLCNTAKCENDARSCSYNSKTKKCTIKQGKATGRVLESEELDELDGENLDDEELEGEEQVHDGLEDSLEEIPDESDEEALSDIEG